MVFSIVLSRLSTFASRSGYVGIRARGPHDLLHSVDGGLRAALDEKVVEASDQVVAFEETTWLKVVAHHDPLGASRRELRELRGIVLRPPVNHLRTEREELAVKLLAEASVPRGPPILALHAGVARQEARSASIDLAARSEVGGIELRRRWAG